TGETGKFENAHQRETCCLSNVCHSVDDMRGFRDLLRMSVEDFNYLLERVSPAIIKKDTHLRKAISPRERLSVTLRFLATGKCTPSTESEWKAIARDFANKWQFPHCLGAIDGKHIFIQPPPKSGSMYFNYKSRFSIILMAVVDANYKFVYASAGTQGRVSDAGVLAHSDLKEAMDTGTLNFPPADTLPGTDAMMPHIIYNYRLSRARRVVENAFGILANRFRVFRTTICLDPDKVVTIIFACLCLHNYLRDHRSDAYVPPGYVDSEDAKHQLVKGAWRREGELQSVSMGLARNPSVEAKKQRDVLCEYFVSPAGSVSWQEDMV
uniref:DDE Tnp4 domain-containing protein n=1 Tax=Oreochromis niloticus TaxID=8128 RepID=I3JLH2_ORENI